MCSTGEGGLGYDGQKELITTYFTGDHFEDRLGYDGQKELMTTCFTDQITQEVKNEHFLIWTRQTNLQIFGKVCLRQSDERTDKYKTRNVMHYEHGLCDDGQKELITTCLQATTARTGWALTGRRS